MENKEQTKSNKKTALIVLLLLIAIVAVILATYAWAKYSETKNGEAIANVAKWNVTATTEGSFTQSFAQVATGKIAPGTSGEFTATLDVTGTEVDVDYTVTLVNVEPVELNEDGTVKQVLTGTAADNVIPYNLVIKDANNAIIYEKNAPVASKNGIIGSGTISKDSATKTASKTFTWEWPYEVAGEDPAQIATRDEQDTKDGQKAGNFRVTYRIDAVQAKPGNTTP